MVDEARGWRPRLIDADAVDRVVTPEMAREAVLRSMVRAAAGDARELPVVRDVLVPAEGRVFGIKSGHDLDAGLVGCKLGGYWPANAAQGRPNHQSTIVLLDAVTGVARAVVDANRITALRTAAAAALSIDALAREDARVLAVLGAGHQAEFHARAACAVRSFTAVRLWNRGTARAGALARELADLGMPVHVCASATEAVEGADVIVTVTGSRAPLFPADAVRPGTHLACMGADTRGKQEVDVALLMRARLYTDVVAQALELGDCQHLPADARAVRSGITALGDVLLRRAPGRGGPDEITLYDGTGTGLQDLLLASRVLAALDDDSGDR